ncbi:MAG: disulfide bond formation protein DsbA [Sphingobium sp. 66-54]|nr:MAG: disulfide bond formation protein DsbA [Sphingobium sp. 66-54]
MTDRSTLPTASRRRLLAPSLLALLVAGGAAVAFAATDKPTPAMADRAAIEAVVHDYILAHPEIIPEAIKRLQAREMAQKVAENRAELETPYKGAWEGAAQPDVTLVAFMDYACGFCRASLPDLARLVKEDPGLRIVYRELPIIAEGSAGAARVSLLAAEGGKFMAFHKAMYAAGDVEPATVLKVAGRIGLDPVKAQAALKSKASDAPIVENVRLAQALDATGTPMFVVGDQVFTGAVGYEALKTAIAEARQGKTANKG